MLNRARARLACLRAVLTSARIKRNQDDGSALVVVLIIMTVLTFAGLTLLTVVVNTTGMVMDNRDSSAGRAAADAGLADVSVMMQQGDVVCDPASPPGPVTSTSTMSVRYSVAIACAVDANGRQTVTLTSTGTGKDGHSTTTEATYGPGLAGALTTMTGGLSLSSSKSQSNGNVIINQGNYHCDGNAIVSESVVVRGGYAHLSNGCSASGSVIAAGSVTLDSRADVGGDVYAIGGTFAIDGSSTKVGGTVYVKGNANLTGGHIYGSLIVTGNVTVSSKAKVDGGIHAGGTISGAGAKNVSPVRAPGIDGSPAPVVSAPWQLAPSAVEWIDVNYVPPMPGQSPAITTCPPADTTATIAGFSRFRTPQIIDWRACPGDINFYQNRVVLNTSITIYLNRTVYLNGVVVSSGNGGEHQFNLIMPDRVADGTPTGPCPAGVRLDINNLQMSKGISGIAYSPCNIDLGGTNWTGAIFGKQVSSFNGSTLTYKDVVLPGGKQLRAPLGPILEMKDIG